MANYQSVQGDLIESVTTDPSNPIEGQIWYNSSSGTLKVYKTINAFSAGGSMNNARAAGPAQNGTQTAALAAGGGYTTASESYNGIAWTNTSPINTAREAPGGAGTQTAALIWGGNSPAPLYNSVPATELWNGTSWTTSPATLNSQHAGPVGGCGTQTAALTAGGGTNPALVGNVTTATELWNGTGWTSNPTGLNVKRYTASMFGIQTAAIISKGNGTDAPPAASNATESWNGTSWTNVANFPSPFSVGYGTAGIQTAGLTMGPSIATLWNGSSWTASGSLGTPRTTYGGSGTQPAALVFGGPTTATEEWNAVGTQTVTVS